MKTSDFDYHLPPECIAQTPLELRDESRLLVLNRSTGALIHTYFHKIGDYLQPGDVLVLNETRVIPARIFANKLPGGGRVELLLLRAHDEKTWEVMVGGQGMAVGRRLRVEGGPQAEIIKVMDGAQRLVAFDVPVGRFIEQAGHTPLPPYIHTPLENGQRYQTIYARVDGSAAAPTAGLHFTESLLTQLEEQGIRITRVLLHVGLDTFAPVKEVDPAEHLIHSEWCQVSAETAAAIRQARIDGRRIIAVGTTSVRTLESAALNAQPDEPIRAFEGSTRLFILPGFRFRIVDGMVTNFHLPRSTLLMLVSAFAGREIILDAYQQAIRCGYRFYSFGDAMLII